MRTSNADIVKRVRAHSPSCAKVGLFDMDGIFRGKYMAADKLESALEKGFGFCDVTLGWDSADQLYDNVSFTGWHTAYPDAEARLLPETLRTLPFEGGIPLILGEFAGAAEAICPRGVLRRILDRAAGQGWAVKAAAEFETFVFAETPQSVRDKGYRDLKPITPGNFGYSMLRSGVHADFYQELWTTCDEMRIALEGLHTETGPGVIEAAIRVDDALEAADKAALFKTILKILCQRRGWMATFMAKWSPDWPGQSGHLHMSLFDAESGRSIFHEAGARHEMSERMRWFVGGQQALMPELLAMVAPTVNSYRRLIPGFWAPTSATWGVENRTTALRVIPGSPKSQRVEYRVAAADGNPYLSCAAALASGLWGIENKLKLGEPVDGNSYDKKHPAKLDLPRTLMEASERLKGSKAARSLFGDAFVEHYAASRNWEER